MAWVIVSGAATSIIGGALASKGANKASKQQYEGTLAGIESQERMFDKALGIQEPYRKAGYESLGELQQLVDPAGRTELLDNYYSGSEFETLRAQEEEQQLRNSAVTGGLRGGGNQAALATITPQLGQQYLSERYNQLTGIANMGMGAASQGSAQASRLGTSISNLQQSGAQAKAANSLAQANIWGNVTSDLSGIATDYFGG